ncbi:unnamed protein product [Sphenostylis stenocarpa]|uniref:Importin N-terminal domain-containing protein n=1 Tax=Sphenostylis stenocarpa TaxID=92480 RepID=A0AA86T969_9FABA|nr:unnamed protein product [Sphenostylis stenocarpa]
METLAQLEAMCERLYNSQDSVERAHAESTLKCFSLNSDYISQCQFVLDNASSPYALMLASSSLLKQVTEQSLPLQLRIDIRNYLINYLASKGPELEPFVLGSLIQLFCRITKFGWLDDDKFREVVKEAMDFLSQLKLASILLGQLDYPYFGQPLQVDLLHLHPWCQALMPTSSYPATKSKLHLIQQLMMLQLLLGQLQIPCQSNGFPPGPSVMVAFQQHKTSVANAQHHYGIGLKILNQLVSEINQHNPGLPATRQRRIASSFRDHSLFQIFQISLTSLFQLKSDVGSKLQELSLMLSLSCLSFDFMGTSYDESSDEIGTVQVPSGWKPTLEDSSTLQIFFDYYAMNQMFSKEVLVEQKALECLLRLASTRRSLFPNDAARMKFLSHLMQGTKEILQTGIGLADHDNYHAFCRLLGRFKLNYQLSELVNAEGYSEWIRSVAEFTLKSLHSWKSGFEPAMLSPFLSCHEVLALSGMSVMSHTPVTVSVFLSVTSVRYLKGDKPNLLDEYVPKVIEGFVSSRFDSLQSELSDELGENPLDNVEVLQDQLEFFPFLCRFQKEANLQSHVDSFELSVTETKLAWFTHIVAAILRTKQISDSSSGESHEVLDAEISACVLQLINISDSGFHSKRYEDVSKQRLDRAILTFFQHLRRCYIGDGTVFSSKQLYTRLSELLGLHDNLLLLHVIVGKMITNLKCYTKCKEVIDHTLNLFLEMTSGYMSGKLLLKLDTVKLMISNKNVSCL